jgi:hypothetical protein
MKKLLLILFFFLPLSCNLWAQTDLNRLIAEMQKSTGKTGEMKFVIWLSNEFWEIIMKNQAGSTEEQVKKMMEDFKPYSMFAVVEGKVNPFGEVEYLSRDSITAHLVLTGNDGKSYRPIDAKTATFSVQMMMGVFEPILTKLFGQFGKNMQVYIFNDINAKKERACDPYKKGYISLKTLSTEYKWRTPIGSLLPLKICPVDKEEMNGAWDFCPWHGDKLLLK